MRELDLKILKKYLEEFILYLCEDEDTWYLDEIGTTLKVVKQKIKENNE